MNKNNTFNSFKITSYNSFAVNASIAVSQNPGKAYNPLFIYGCNGSGKTHLIQAIGNYILDNSNNKIIYVTSKIFINEYVQGISNREMFAFKDKYRKTDVLLIDDIQYFQGNPGSQEELFHTINYLIAGKKQLVFTCDRPVLELKKVSEHLSSRLQQGLCVDLIKNE